MRGWTWITSGFPMTVITVTMVVFLAIGARGFLQTRLFDPPVPVQSGPLPQALADEIKRNAHASYLLGIKDAVEFWRLTGVVPDAPGLREALWARRQASPNPLTPSDAKAMLQHLLPDAEP
jgi:hypothetical protein